MTDAVLAVERLVAGYEPGLPVLRGASVALAAGEVLAVLGPNGAGKSTLAKAAAGLLPVVESGRVLLEGRDVTRLPAHRRAREGLGFVPQSENVFASLTVAENLDLAAALVGADRARAASEAYALFPDLADARGKAAGRLSGGQRQMLALCRALAARPRALLLDEPTAGLSPAMVRVMLDAVGRVAREGGVAVLLVEQNARAALAAADRALVMVGGRNRLEGPARAVAADPRLAALYVAGAVDEAEEDEALAPAAG